MRRPSPAMPLASVPAVLAVLVAFAVVATSAGATTIRLHPLEALAGAADRITHGSVVDSRVERDERGELWTVYTLLVSEELKDASLSAGASFEFRQFGGTLDGETVQAVGFPQFRPGEEVLLFLAGVDERPQVMNAWQGAVRIEAEAARPGGAPTRRVRGVERQFPDVRTTELEAFKRAIAAALGGERP